MIFSVTGPESSGKTTLCHSIHLTTNWLWIPEYSRNYLRRPPVSSIQEMILRIASAQSSLETLQCYKETCTLSDTDSYTFAIWWLDKVGNRLPPLLSAWLEKSKTTYQHVFLCYPDIPWEADPLREDETRRTKLFQDYLDLLSAQSVPFTRLKGPHEERKALAIEIIESISSPGSFPV